MRESQCERFFQQYLSQLATPGCLQGEEFVAQCVAEEFRVPTLRLIRENEEQARKLSEQFSHDQSGTEWLKGNTVFGRFRLERRLGNGSSGVVWEATDLVLLRVVALKVLRAHLVDERSVERLALEARVLAGLDSPGVMKLYSTVHDAEVQALVTECVGSGDTLKTLLDTPAEKWNPGGKKEVVRLLLPPLYGLALAHELGILHRDIKPSNMLWSGQGFKLCDFGLATLLDGSSGLTMTGEFLGTRTYASPEQHRGNNLKPSSDVYSFGLLLWEALSLGKFVAVDKGLRELDWQGRRAKKWPAAFFEFPQDLQAVLLKALHPVPEHRYVDAGAFARDLDAWLKGFPVAARIPSTLTKAGQWIKRNPIASAIGVVLFTAISLAVVGGWRAKNAEKQATNALFVAKGIIQSQNTWLQASEQGSRRAHFRELNQLLLEDRTMAPELKGGLWAVLAEGFMLIGSFTEADLAFAKANALVPSSLLQVMHAWCKLEVSHRFEESDPQKKETLNAAQSILLPIAGRTLGLDPQDDYAIALARNRLLTIYIFLSKLRSDVVVSPQEFMDLTLYLEGKPSFPAWLEPMNRVDLGIFYLHRKRYPEAVVAFDAAIAAFLRKDLRGHDEMIYAYIGRQEALVESGKVQESCAALEDIVFALRDQGKGYTPLVLTHQKEWGLRLLDLGETRASVEVLKNLELRLLDPRFEGSKEDRESLSASWRRPARSSGDK